MDHRHSLLPRPSLAWTISPTHTSRFTFGEDSAGLLLSLPGNSVFSSVHRDWELGEEGLLSWHSDHLSWRSAFPRHGSSLLSPPRQSALLTCSILQPPTSCFPPMSFMHADASSCLLSHRAHLKDNFPEVYQEQLKDGSVMVFGQGFYKHLNPSLGQLTYYVQAQNTVKAWASDPKTSGDFQGPWLDTTRSPRTYTKLTLPIPSKTKA